MDELIEIPFGQIHVNSRNHRPLTLSCFSKIQVGFTFLVPAHLGSPGHRAVKRVCVCRGNVGISDSQHSLAVAVVCLVFVLIVL